MWLKLNAALQLIPRQGKLYSIRYDLMLQCCNKMNAHNTSYLNDDQIIHMDNLWSDYTLIIAAYLFISVNNLFSRSSFNIHYWWSLFLSHVSVIMWSCDLFHTLGHWETRIPTLKNNSFMSSLGMESLLSLLLSSLGLFSPAWKQ